jgi:hypothetical protein
MRRPVLSWYDPTTDEVRASNGERDAAATRLGAHLTAGRLEWDEYDQRLQAAYAAKTRGDLAKLFTDLPEEEQPARGRQRSARQDRSPALAIAVAVAMGCWLLMKAGLLITFLVAFLLIRVLGGLLMSGPHGRGRHGSWGRGWGPAFGQWPGARAAWHGPFAAWGGPSRRHGFSR